MADDGRGFGGRLVACRQLTGLSQEELAVRSELSVRAIRNLERSRTRWPHPDTVRRLADALELRGEARDEFTAAAGRRLAGGAASVGGPGAAAPAGDRSGWSAGPGTPVPRQLPAGVRDFTGRDAELDVLTSLLEAPGPSGAGPVVISAIGGTAGAGKTALALQWAHQIAGRFGDGQLHVNLRGFAPAGVPAPPEEAVRGFLDALGVPPERIPLTLEAQAALYRSLLAERQMLIFLDNARDEQQVRPLLPASPASLVIVTSRNQLAGLAVSDGARLLSLDMLPHDDAVQLLTARIGTHRAAAEPGAIGEIAALCAHLPLALAVTAARAAARPGFPLTQLAAELRDAAGRLDVLDAGDPAVSVRAVFSWSYRLLGPDAARMFRLLGLHPGPDISVRAAASLAAVDEPQARRLLRELARDCLITEHAPGRYAFHDLLRAYAAATAREHDGESDRNTAIGRVLDHYLHTASRSGMLLHPSGEPVALAPPRPGTCPERPGDHRQALAWFEAEHQVLLAAVTLAAETAADRHAWQLPCAMFVYLHRRHPQELVTVMRSAVAAATRLNDALGQAMSLRYLGTAYTDTGDYDQARAHLERCLPLYQQAAGRMGEAWARHNLSLLAEAQGRYADALGHDEQALRLFQAIGHETGAADMLASVGWFHALLGDYQRARPFCEQSLALTAKLGGRHSEYLLDTFGYIELQLGSFSQAITHFEAALVLCRDHGDRRVEAAILTHIGDTHHAAGELARAWQAWQQALAIYDGLQHPDAGKVLAKLASTQAERPRTITHAGPDLSSRRECPAGRAGGRGPGHGGCTTEGTYARLAQRLLPMAACVWHKWARLLARQRQVHGVLRHGAAQGAERRARRGASHRKELPMSNQTTEELLLAGMERFTADVTAPSGLAVRAARYRRRRIAAAAATAAAATAGAVVATVAVAGPAPVPGSQQAQTAAYMVSRSESALAAATSSGLVESTRVTLSGQLRIFLPVDSSMAGFVSSSGYKGDTSSAVWVYRQQYKFATYTSSGQLASVLGTAAAHQQQTATSVDYQNRTWWQSTQAPPRPPANPGCKGPVHVGGDPTGTATLTWLPRCARS